MLRKKRCLLLISMCILLVENTFGLGSESSLLLLDNPSTSSTSEGNNNANNNLGGGSSSDSDSFEGSSGESNGGGPLISYTVPRGPDAAGSETVTATFNITPGLNFTWNNNITDNRTLSGSLTVEEGGLGGSRTLTEPPLPCVPIPKDAFLTRRILSKVWVMSIPTEMFLFADWLPPDSFQERDFIEELFATLHQQFPTEILPVTRRERSRVFQATTCLVDFQETKYQPFGFDVCYPETPACTSATQQCAVKGVLECVCPPALTFGGYPTVGFDFGWNRTEINSTRTLEMTPTPSASLSNTTFNASSRTLTPSLSPGEDVGGSSSSGGSGSASSSGGTSSFDSSSGVSAAGATAGTTERGFNTQMKASHHHPRTSDVGSGRELKNRLMKVMQLIGNVQIEFLFRLDNLYGESSEGGWAPCSFEEIEETYDQLLEASLSAVRGMASKYFFDASKISYRYVFARDTPTASFSATPPSKSETIVIPVTPVPPTPAPPAPVVNKPNLWPLLILLIFPIGGLCLLVFWCYRKVTNSRYRSRAFHVTDRDSDNQRQDEAENFGLFGIGNTGAGGKGLDDLGRLGGTGGPEVFDPLDEVITGGGDAPLEGGESSMHNAPLALTSPLKDGPDEEMTTLDNNSKRDPFSFHNNNSSLTGEGDEGSGGPLGIARSPLYDRQGHPISKISSGGASGGGRFNHSSRSGALGAGAATAGSSSSGFEIMKKYTQSSGLGSVNLGNIKPIVEDDDDDREQNGGGVRPQIESDAESGGSSYNGNNNRGGSSGTQSSSSKSESSNDDYYGGGGGRYSGGGASTTGGGGSRPRASYRRRRY